MQASCVIIELKPNSRARVEEWATFILENKSEAIATLEKEGVTVESFFITAIEHKDYLVGYMRAESIEHAKAVVSKSLAQIDAYHQQFKKDTWLQKIESKLVLDLSL